MPERENTIAQQLIDVIQQKILDVKNCFSAECVTYINKNKSYIGSCVNNTMYLVKKHDYNTLENFRQNVLEAAYSLIDTPFEPNAVKEVEERVLLYCIISAYIQAWQLVIAEPERIQDKKEHVLKLYNMLNAMVNAWGPESQQIFIFDVLCEHAAKALFVPRQNDTMGASISPGYNLEYIKFILDKRYSCETLSEGRKLEITSNFKLPSKVTLPKSLWSYMEKNTYSEQLEVADDRLMMLLFFERYAKDLELVEITKYKNRLIARCASLFDDQSLQKLYNCMAVSLVDNTSRREVMFNYSCVRLGVQAPRSSHEFSRLLRNERHVSKYPEETQKAIRSVLAEVSYMNGYDAGLMEHLACEMSQRNLRVESLRPSL